MIKRKITIVFGLILITILFVALLEGFARILFGTPPGDVSATMPDPILNHKWKPNLVYTDLARGIFPYTLYTNKQSWVGRTDISVNKPKNTIRIFYMGDSNVQGVVPEGKKMVDIVSKELNNKAKKNGKSIEIINTGTSSWAPSLYYLLVTTQMMKYSPDIVVINVDMTDVRDDAVYRKLTKYNDKNLPIAVRPSDEKDRAVYRMTPQGVVKITESQQFITYLNKNSALYYNFNRLYQTLGKNNELRKALLKSEISTVPPIDDASWLAKKFSEQGKNNATYSMQMLANTIDYLHEHNVKVVITGVPHYPQYTGEWSNRPHQIIKETAEKHKAPFLNSYESLKPKIKDSKQSDYYWDVDPTHFNEEGNKLWADLQTQFLLNPKNKILVLN